ncbi:MAG: MBL fold metallo-hydrolase [Candidatus Melainabacteria bacterium]|nr:MBL fold metallo-hydrolase [Candidatus Melainabacteria bacterium]
MKITFYGSAGGNVIPSRLLLHGQDPDDSTLVDCGDAIPEKGEKKKDIDFSPLIPSDVRNVLLTHGHTDHVGALPSFVQHGFTGEIISTEPTKQITEALLRDNYREDLVDDVFDLYARSKEYLDEFSLSPNVTATFYPAMGHILGASAILLELQKEGLKVLFSGDLGNTNKNMLEVSGEVPEADIVVIESTYGRREHHPDFEESLSALYKGINDTYNNSGNFYIPVLSINRLQEALYYINMGIERGLIPRDVNVVVDSTLGEVITEIYNKKSNRKYYSDEAKDFFSNFSKAYPFTFRNHLNPKGRNIVLASSGLDGLRGRFRKYIKELSSDEKSSVAVVSHTLEGSLLDDIKAGKHQIGLNGNSLEFKAKSFNLSGFSSHADATQLLSWLEKTKAKYVFLVHGENDSRDKLKEMIVERGLCPRENIFTPALLEEVDLTNLAEYASKAKTISSSQTPVASTIKEEPSASKTNEDNGTKVTLFGQELEFSKPLQ